MYSLKDEETPLWYNLNNKLRIYSSWLDLVVRLCSEIIWAAAAKTAERRPPPHPTLKPYETATTVKLKRHKK